MTGIAQTGTIQLRRRKPDEMKWLREAADALLFDAEKVLLEVCHGTACLESLEAFAGPMQAFAQLLREIEAAEAEADRPAPAPMPRRRGRPLRR